MHGFISDANGLLLHGARRQGWSGAGTKDFKVQSLAAYVRHSAGRNASVLGLYHGRFTVNANVVQHGV
jgi:hypothetical protein